VSEELLTPEEIAKQLRVSTEAVQAWCRSGRMKAIRAGRQWRITREALDEFTRQEVQPKKQSPKANGLAVTS
jgi:excisionase family DNA binding protein